MIDSSNTEQTAGQLRPTQWGRWSYNERRFALSGPEAFEVYLDFCATWAQMGRWIHMVPEQPWVQQGDLEDLLRALRDILNPKTNVINRGCDPREVALSTGYITDLSAMDRRHCGRLHATHLAGRGHSTRWGRWRYDPENFTLEGPLGYQLDLDQCTTAAQILGWIQWMIKAPLEVEDFGQLVIALSHLLPVDSGIIRDRTRGNREFDPRAEVAKRGYNAPPSLTPPETELQHV